MLADAAQARVEQFLKKWKGSQGNERANYQGFFLDLCDALGVDKPPPKGSVPGDPYCFDRDIKVLKEDQKLAPNYIDFYKQGCFVIEAKQGGEKGNKGTAKRNTKSYDRAMEGAFYQAHKYATSPDIAPKPPFLMTCDIGSHFEIWDCFGGDYAGYGARRIVRLDDLRDEDVFNQFVAIFTDPLSLDPAKYQAKVTREVADTLAQLARWLESAPVGENGEPPTSHDVANFLMRCIFTMFAEDVKLLQEEVFTKALRDRWIPNPSTFKKEIEGLWATMNTGGMFGFHSILRFNGSFFADAKAFDLPKEQLEILAKAAEKNWSKVEPAIFGTLLERALDKKERSRLGAHYTPRSYVERLVRPVVMEPLREEWQLVELHVDQILTLKEGKDDLAKDQVKKAAAEIEGFLDKLQQIRILDPACGTGNFLYVTMDLMKRLEQEAQTRLLDIVGTQTTDLLQDYDPRLAGRRQVNPRQFLGIELNPRAAAIAELVIWIGYLQWHFRRYGTTPPPEPILQDFHNIECRDAVLAYDGKEPDVDPKTGKVRTRWGGRMMKHLVTGEDVPDPSDQIAIYRYINPRPTEWPEADYVVSNPPFIGNAWMRERLGDGYAAAIRQVYESVSETVDYVMYWWHKAAQLAREKAIHRFGFITTNSISQVFQRRVIEFHLKAKDPIRIIFAIANHPWVDDGADVRIAMTVGECDHPKLSAIPKILQVKSELKGNTPEESAEKIELLEIKGVRIYSNLQAGVNLSEITPLRSNQNLCCPGVKLHGSGFIVKPEDLKKLEKEVVHPYLNGRDLQQISRGLAVIDLFGLSELESQKRYPKAYQWVYEKVKPERDQNNRKSYKDNWWIFGEPRANFRPALKHLSNYIATVETSRHRTFTFLSKNVIPDNKITCIASGDTLHLGILSSKIHVTWALATGSRLGVGDDPVYVKTRCFDPFPFPDPTPEQKQRIRELGDRLDSHRKQVQAQHPDITITRMYNLLEKLRAGEPFTDADREYNQKALVSILKQIHDDLDAAVLEAYGWDDLKDDTGRMRTDIDEIILERLVALNAERAEEERNGYIRWLRPEYQAPEEVQTQKVLAGIVPEEEAIVEPVEQQKWPTKAKEQLAAIRDLLRTTSGQWTVEQIAAQFTGKNTKGKLGAVAENLERLEWFGLVISRQDENGVVHWQFTESSTQAA